jgi:uncharacterized coiled-coil DUF342 family protein
VTGDTRKEDEMTEETTPPTPDEVDEFLDSVENWHDSMPFYNDDLGKLLKEFRRLREEAPKMRARRDALALQVQNYHKAADEHVAKYDRKHEALLKAQSERDGFREMMNSAVSAGVVVDGERLDALREVDRLEGKLNAVRALVQEATDRMEPVSWIETLTEIIGEDA